MVVCNTASGNRTSHLGSKTNTAEKQTRELTMRRLSYFPLDFFSFAEAQRGEGRLKHTAAFKATWRKIKLLCALKYKIWRRETSPTAAPMGCVALPSRSSPSCHIVCFPQHFAIRSASCPPFQSRDLTLKGQVRAKRLALLRLCNCKNLDIGASQRFHVSLGTTRGGDGTGWKALEKSPQRRRKVTGEKGERRRGNDMKRWKSQEPLIHGVAFRSLFEDRPVRPHRRSDFSTANGQG